MQRKEKCFDYAVLAKAARERRLWIKCDCCNASCPYVLRCTRCTHLWCESCFDEANHMKLCRFYVKKVAVYKEIDE